MLFFALSSSFISTSKLVVRVQGACYSNHGSEDLAGSCIQWALEMGFGGCVSSGCCGFRVLRAGPA